MFLKSAFRKAACGAIAALAAGAAIAAMPTLPLAEDVLVQAGIPQNEAKAIVVRLAGTDSVRVLTNTSLEHIRQELKKMSKSRDGARMRAADVQQIIWQFDITTQYDSANSGFGNAAKSWADNFMPPSVPVRYQPQQAACYVKISEEKNAADIILSTTGIPQQDIERPPISVAEYFWVSYFHELRHCNKENKKLRPVMSYPFANLGDLELEIDADFHALNDDGIPFITRDLAQRWAYFRTLTPNFTDHQTGLALGAGSTITAEMVEQAYRDVHKLVLAKAPDMKDKHPFNTPHYFLELASVYKAILEDKDIKPEPPSKLLMVLYLEAAQYIAPERFALMVERKGSPSGPAFNMN